MERVAPMPVTADVHALAARIPDGVRLGTSSWAYPGWRGLVYAPRAPVAALATDGLAAYAASPLFGTVGLDRAFYAAPSREQYASLAQLVPGSFRFTVKAEQRCTRPDLAADGTTFGNATSHRAGAANPQFLDAVSAWERVVAPALEGLGDRMGPMVFQFPHLDLSARGRLGGADALLARIGAFLGELARCAGGDARWMPVVELRNREVLQPAHVRAYVDAIGAGAAVHSYLQHPTVATPAAQERALAEAGAPARDARAVVVRWMLLSDATYDEASLAFEPFDRIRAPDPATRTEVVGLLEGCGRGRPGYVVCNNKAEGCAARSVRAIAEELAARGPG
jgi:uncharacterized protein YecE (DUF72 family)